MSQPARQTGNDAKQPQPWQLTIANGVASGVVSAIVTVLATVAVTSTAELTGLEKVLLASTVFFFVLAVTIVAHGVIRNVRARRNMPDSDDGEDRAVAELSTAHSPARFEQYRLLLSQAIFDVLWQRREPRRPMKLADVCSGVRSLGYPSTEELSDSDLAIAIREVHRLRYIRALSYADGRFWLEGSTLALARNQQRAAKSVIATTAVQLVTPGMTIGIDGGSTLELFAQMLVARLLVSADASLRVVTPAVAVCDALASWHQPGTNNVGDQMGLSFLGGRLSVDGGISDISLLRSDYTPSFDIVFIGAAGMDRGGFYVTEYAVTGAKKFMIAHAKRAIVLADSSKLGRVFSNRFGEWGDLELLCDRPAFTQQVTSRYYFADRTTFATKPPPLEPLS